MKNPWQGLSQRWVLAAWLGLALAVALPAQGQVRLIADGMRSAGALHPFQGGSATATLETVGAARHEDAHYVLRYHRGDAESYCGLYIDFGLAPIDASQMRHLRLRMRGEAGDERVRLRLHDAKHFPRSAGIAQDLPPLTRQWRTFSVPLEAFPELDASQLLLLQIEPLPPAGEGVIYLDSIFLTRAPAMTSFWLVDSHRNRNGLHEFSHADGKVQYQPVTDPPRRGGYALSWYNPGGQTGVGLMADLSVANDRQPLDLSAMHSLSLLVKGASPQYQRLRIALDDAARDQRSEATIVHVQAGPHWNRIDIPLDALPGLNAAQLTRLAIEPIGAGEGHVTLDRVRFIPPYVPLEMPPWLEEAFAALELRLGDDAGQVRREFEELFKRADQEREIFGDVVRVRQARTLLAYAESQRSEPDRNAGEGEFAFEAARAALQETIETAPPQSPPGFLARNELGVALMTRGNMDEARKLFEEAGELALTASVSSRTRASFYTNYGLCLENMQLRQPAYQQFRAAVQADARLNPPIRHAFRLLRSFQAPVVENPSADAAELAESLLFVEETMPGTIDVPLVRAEVYRCLNRWGSTEVAARFFESLLRSYVASRIDQWAYDRQPPPRRPPEDAPRDGEPPPDTAALMQITPERTKLQTLALKHKPLQQLVEVLERVYFADLPMFRDRESVAAAFAAYLEAGGTSRVLSRVLTLSADGYLLVTDVQPEQAVSRYQAAWLLDPGNSRAASHLSVALTTYAERTDPEGALLQRFSRQLFDEQKEAPDNFHYRGRYHSVEDWRNIRMLHMTLGAHFEDQPQSALFQWRAAEFADVRLRQLGAAYQHLPYLYENLAGAWLRDAGEAKPTSRAAFDALLHAAQGHLWHNDLENAVQRVSQARRAWPPENWEKSDERRYQDTNTHIERIQAWQDN